MVRHELLHECERVWIVTVQERRDVWRLDQRLHVQVCIGMGGHELCGEYRRVRVVTLPEQRHLHRRSC